MPSAYIEKRKREVPNSEDKERYLTKLRNLKWLMISSRLGGVGHVGGTALGGFSPSSASSAQLKENPSSIQYSSPTPSHRWIISLKASDIDSPGTVLLLP